MGNFYTDAAAIAASLRLAPDTTLSVLANAGDQSITLESTQNASGNALYPGMSLALDYYLGQGREVVTIDSVAGLTINLTSPLRFIHRIGSPVKEVSAINNAVGAGSRLVDDACSTAPGAFALQSYTETLLGNVDSKGRVFVGVTGRNVTLVSSFSWQESPLDTPIVVPVNQLTFDDYQMYAWDSAPRRAVKNLLVNVSYSAGFDPLPDDIVSAATVGGARLFKSGEAGFSDVIGNSDLGILSYKKVLPPDILLMLKHWKRWS